MRFDRHAISEAAELLDEQAVSMAFAKGMPGAVKRLIAWMRRPRRLRDPATTVMHIDEMAGRLRRMLERPKRSKGASRKARKARRPVMTRKAKGRSKR